MHNSDEARRRAVAQGTESKTGGRSGRGVPISRRKFLAGSAVAAGAVATGCNFTDRQETAGPVPLDAPQFPPLPPTPAPPPGMFSFFTRDEARTIEAVAARIIPDGEDGPGATDAGVVGFIDAQLAAYEGFAEPTFMSAPHADTFDGDTPPDEDDDDVVWVQEDELERYGFQSSLGPQEIYRRGIAALNEHAQTLATTSMLWTETGRTKSSSASKRMRSTSSRIREAPNSSRPSTSTPCRGCSRTRCTAATATWQGGALSVTRGPSVPTRPRTWIPKGTGASRKPWMTCLRSIPGRTSEVMSTFR